MKSIPISGEARKPTVHTMNWVVTAIAIRRRKNAKGGVKAKTVKHRRKD